MPKADALGPLRPSAPRGPLADTAEPELGALDLAALRALRREAQQDRVGPLSGRAPLNVYLDGTATKSSNPGGWISRFGWDLGDGTTSTSGFLYHTYSKPGRYRVLLRAFDEGGRVGTAEQVIIVN